MAEQFDFKFDKSNVAKYKLGEEPSDSEYWLTRSPEERLAAVEYLRLMHHGAEEYYAPMKRVFRKIKLHEQ